MESPEPVKSPPLHCILSPNICLTLTLTNHQTTMCHHDAPPTDPHAFSLWPDNSATSEEERAKWAQPAGYAQPGFTFENDPFDVLDATFAWGQDSTTPAEISDLQNNAVGIFTFGA